MPIDTNEILPYLCSENIINYEFQIENNIAMRILLIPKILLIMVVLVSCGDQSGEIKFQTIALEGFEKHPKGAAENDGFSYKINFQYPTD